MVLHHGRGADENDLLGARRRARPRAPPPRRHPARAAPAARLARLPLVRRAARRLPRPRHVPRGLRRRSPSCTTSCGSGPALDARADRVRRLLDGLGDELLARARPGPPGARRGSSRSRASSRSSRAGSPTLAGRAEHARVHRPRPQRPDHGRAVRAHARASCSRPAACRSSTTSPTPGTTSTRRTSPQPSRGCGRRCRRV